jgi:hypothetical protein
MVMRAEAIEDAAALLPDAPLTVRAKDMARRLGRYADTEWKRRQGSTPPDHPLSAALHRVLEINTGRSLGWRTIYDTLQNSPLEAATRQPDSADHARRSKIDAAP